MAGLVEYCSSDEDENLAAESVTPTLVSTTHERLLKTENTNGSASDLSNNGYQGPSEQTPIQSSEPLDAPILGPTIGPTMPTDGMDAAPLPEDEAPVSTPMSPYSANQALLRDLTMPTIPNLDIPPSPPHSPPATTNAKFAHFLKLKKQGVHFNDKLSKSSALKNPSLMQKLMDFADINELDQYATTLPESMWDPKAFPAWAYKEELAKAQQEVLKKRETDKKGTVDFVPATVADSSKNGTPTSSIAARSGPKSAAERVMAGLERGRPNIVQSQAGVKRKSRFDS